MCLLRQIFQITEGNETIVSGLSAATIYVVTVEAYNNGGQSPGASMQVSTSTCRSRFIIGL